MASLHQRTTKDGVSWRLHYRIDGHQKVVTFHDADTAAYWKARFDVSPAGAEDAMRQTLDAPPEDPTVRQIVTEHIEQLSGIRARTRADYLRDASASIFPEFGDHPSSAVTKALVSAWVNKLEADGLSGKTIGNHHALLSAAFASAIERYPHLVTNPCKGTKIPRHVPEVEMTCMSHGDFAVLLDCIPEHYRPLVTFLAGSGLRWGEATALRIGDVDLESPSPSVRVSKAVGRDDGGRLFIGPTKTKRSRRMVRLAPEAAKAARESAGDRRKDDFLFVTQTGRMVAHNNFHQRVWKTSMERLRKEHAWATTPRIHDLRHTFASWLLGAGVPITEVQRAMGHESIVTTVQVYGHLQRGAGDAVAEAISVALSPSAPAIEA